MMEISINPAISKSVIFPYILQRQALILNERKLGFQQECVCILMTLHILFLIIPYVFVWFFIGNMQPELKRKLRQEIIWIPNSFLLFS
jgi:hypothetical protein